MTNQPKPNPLRVEVPDQSIGDPFREFGNRAFGNTNEEHMAEMRSIDPGNYGGDAVFNASNPLTWEIWAAPSRPEVIYNAFPEFTCLCPRSGYPDFATVHIILVPDAHVVELKHLKLWLNSFRERRISHEATAVEILETLAQVIEPRMVFVLLEYKPRGNLTTFPMVEWYHPDTTLADFNDTQVSALAQTVRESVIHRALANIKG